MSREQPRSPRELVVEFGGSIFATNPLHSDLGERKR
jgi:hypothetical protein